MGILHCTAIALLAICSHSLLDSIQGLISYNLSTSCLDILVSHDGGTLACSYYSLKTIEIYLNTGVGFGLDQTIQLSVYPHNIGMSKDAARIYVTGDIKFLILEKALNSTYTAISEVSYPSHPLFSDISEDETMLATTNSDGRVRIFKQNGATYSLFQTINEAFTCKGVALSQDKNLLFLGASDLTLRVYRNDGSSFVPN